MGSIALSLFAVLVWKLLPVHDAALILGAALAGWFAAATLIWRLRKLHICSNRRQSK
jgi:hypothetical protein